jgi:hypothetical protein
MYRYNRGKILKGDSINTLFARNRQEIESTITSEDENYLLNMNEEEYLDHLHV